MSGVDWHRAHRNWEAAVQEWVQATGWERPGRPALNALNLARTRLPWSRQRIQERGDLALLEWLEGRAPMPRGNIYRRIIRY
ncbi:hypothetical protein [Intrasporangium mesophilum]